jgi:hypothetical protein
MIIFSKISCRRIKLKSCIISRTKNVLKWIKQLNAKPETIKLLQENVREMVFDVLFNDFWILHQKYKHKKQK